jgi:hypothetical protein
MMLLVVGWSQSCREDGAKEERERDIVWRPGVCFLIALSGTRSLWQLN